MSHSSSAFTADCNALLDAILSFQNSPALHAQRRAKLAVAVRDEAQRIHRLCLHKQLGMPPSEIERAFCICCAFAVKQPHIWKVLLERLSERRVTNWQVAKVGVINLKEVKRFIQRLVVSLSLEIVKTDPVPDLVRKNGAAPLQPAGKLVSTSTVSDIDLLVGESEAQDVVDPGLGQSDNPAGTRRSTRAQKDKLKATSVPAVVEVESDEEPVSAPDARNRNLFQLRDWAAIEQRVASFNTRFPSWSNNHPDPKVNAILRRGHTWMPFADAIVDAECSACGSSQQHRAKELHDVGGNLSTSGRSFVYKCCECSENFHQQCIAPPQRDVFSPFRCLACRLALGRKRSRDVNDDLITTLASRLVVSKATVIHEIV